MFKKIFITFLVFAMSSNYIMAASKVKTKEVITKVFSHFDKGQYEEVNKILDEVQKKIKKSSENFNNIQGLVFYWKGMSLSRMNEFEAAEEYFIKALKLKYFTNDIYYEYGQVLYVSNKYKRARIAFKKSVKANYKAAVSL